MKTTISIMKELCDALEAGKRDNVLPVLKKMEEFAKTTKEVKLTPEDEKKLMEKYKPEMEAIQKRMMAVMPKAMASGALKPEDMQEFAKSMQNLKK